jgi:SAM-dependent methyltransferase
VLGAPSATGLDAAVLAGFCWGATFRQLAGPRHAAHWEHEREREHWDRVYAEHATDAVSWFEPVPSSSLAMIDGLGIPLDAPIVDVGGGASRLAAELLYRGYSNITVIDISGAALERAREDFAGAEEITWVLADVRDHSFGRRFALWHDRAAFHFMVTGEDQRAYRRRSRGVSRRADT